jgi:hypothetical protein
MDIAQLDEILNNAKINRTKMIKYAQGGVLWQGNSKVRLSVRLVANNLLKGAICATRHP